MPDTTPINVAVNVDTTDATKKIDTLAARISTLTRKSFWIGVFSDGGEPSSSRILTFALALAVTIIIAGVFRHVCKLNDPTTLGMWLSNLPLVIAALVGLMATPYSINKVSGSVSDVISAMRGKRD